MNGGWWPARIPLAGRIPTARGYRLFVDTMLTARREQLATMPSLPQDQPQRVMKAHAAQALTNTSRSSWAWRAPARSSVFRPDTWNSLALVGRASSW